MPPTVLPASAGLGPNASDALKNVCERQDELLRQCENPARILGEAAGFDRNFTLGQLVEKLASGEAKTLDAERLFLQDRSLPLTPVIAYRVVTAINTLAKAAENALRPVAPSNETMQYLHGMAQQVGMQPGIRSLERLAELRVAAENSRGSCLVREAMVYSWCNAACNLRESGLFPLPGTEQMEFLTGEKCEPSELLAFALARACGQETAVEEFNNALQAGMSVSQALLQWKHEHNACEFLWRTLDEGIVPDAGDAAGAYAEWGKDVYLSACGLFLPPDSTPMESLAHV